MKKSILIAYGYMMIGGSTTSLLSILNEINYDEYDVDLIFLDDKGALQHMIPKEVRAVYTALDPKMSSRLHKLLHPRTAFYMVYSRAVAALLSGQYSYGGVKAQVINRENARASKRLGKYDVAIAFIETWATEYVAKYVEADRKIAWYHLDYKGAGFCPWFDKHTYDAFNRVILVSEQCKTNFDEVFPQYASKTEHIDNILTDKYIKSRANEFEQQDVVHSAGTLNIVTTCRIDFPHKGLDRAVSMLSKALAECKNAVYTIKWHILGDGADLKALRELIQNNGLEQTVYTYGAKNNPLPWVCKADLFLLPSRYEGKPMAVTEAMLLGVPPFVTNYASAHEQIENGVDGIIVENSDEGLLRGFIELLSGEIDIERLKRNVHSRNYSNIEEMEKINALIRE